MAEKATPHSQTVTNNKIKIALALWFLQNHLGLYQLYHS
jgi:hypothetical protein